jgi:hypothetical protein
MYIHSNDMHTVVPKDTHSVKSHHRLNITAGESKQAPSSWLILAYYHSVDTSVYESGFLVHELACNQPDNTSSYVEVSLASKRRVPLTLTIHGHTPKGPYTSYDRTHALSRSRFE